MNQNMKTTVLTAIQHELKPLFDEAGFASNGWWFCNGYASVFMGIECETGAAVLICDVTVPGTFLTSGRAFRSGAFSNYATEQVFDVPDARHTELLADPKCLDNMKQWIRDTFITGSKYAKPNTISV